MNPQAATAMQPAKGAVPIKQPAGGDIFKLVQKTYEATARRAFEIFESNGRWPGHELADWFRAESELLHPLHLEITETDNALTVRAEVPGFDAKDLEVNVEPRRLMLSGKHDGRKDTDKGTVIYSERSAQQILRAVELPADVDGSKASAILKDGIVNIELPKAASFKRFPGEPKAA